MTEEVLYQRESSTTLPLLRDQDRYLHRQHPSPLLDSFPRMSFSSVVMSLGSVELVQHGVIVLAGWGTSISPDMMQNQVEYSGVYRPELKEKRYIEFLSACLKSPLGLCVSLVLREREHVDYLRPLVQRSEGPLIQVTSVPVRPYRFKPIESTGYVGTMRDVSIRDELYACHARNRFVL